MKHFRQPPIINPLFDEEDDIEILHQEASHDWDDERQEWQFRNLSRWGDLKDIKYNEKVE